MNTILIVRRAILALAFGVSTSCGADASGMTGDVSIDSDQDLDALTDATPASLSSLVIGGLSLDAAEIEIRGLVEVEGELSISITEGVQRVSLPDLERVGEVLAIADNDTLVELDLPKLEHAGAILAVRNDALEALSFPALTSSGPMVVADNDSLTRLEAERLAEVTSEVFDSGSVAIEGNAVLDTVSLPSLQSLWDLDVSENASLLELEVSSLESLTFGLSVAYNDRLQRLTFPALTVAAESLFIVGASLEQLDLPSLEDGGNAFLSCELLRDLALPSAREFTELALQDTSLERLMAPKLERVTRSLYLPRRTIAYLSLSSLTEGCEELVRYDLPACALDEVAPRCRVADVEPIENCICSPDGNLQQAVCPASTE